MDKIKGGRCGANELITFLNAWVDLAEHQRSEHGTGGTIGEICVDIIKPMFQADGPQSGINAPMLDALLAVLTERGYRDEMLAYVGLWKDIEGAIGGRDGGARGH